MVLNRANANMKSQGKTIYSMGECNFRADHRFLQASIEELASREKKKVDDDSNG